MPVNLELVLTQAGILPFWGEGLCRHCPRSKKTFCFYLIRCVLTGITNILLNLPRLPSPHLPSLIAPYAFISERNAGFFFSFIHCRAVSDGVSIEVVRFKETVGARYCLAGSHACWACSLHGPSIMALGRPLDLGLRGVQLISVKLLVV